MNFEADHAELVGVTPNKHLRRMLELIEDNVVANEEAALPQP